MTAPILRNVKGSELTWAELDANFTNLTNEKESLSNKDISNGYVGLTLFKINFRNFANTVTSYLANTNTATRTYTFKDADGTVAFTSDITGTNTGINTGDETLATIKTKLGITVLSGSNTGDQVLPTTLPASDVSAWAKAALKPAYAFNEITSAAISATTGTFSGAISATNVSGTNTGDETLATIKTKLGITTLSGSNTGDQVLPTTLPASDVSAWAKAATKPVYAYSELTSPPTIPTTLPASDVSAWAKAATKPAYTAAEVSALPISGGTLTGTLIFGNATSPNAQTIQFGDNTGWALRMMTTVASVPTVRFTFLDTGSFTAVGALAGSNLSGTNTGDETLATIKTKLGITTLSGSNTGDQVLPTTLPASDVSAWAKAALKPTYAFNEITSAAISATTGTFSGAISATNVSGTNTGDETLATIKTKLGITTLSGSNTGDQTIPTTLPASDVFAWAKAATKPTYAYSEITSPPTIPTTLPASDVFAWAKAATKPAYTYTEVGAQIAGSYPTGSGTSSGTNTGDQTNVSGYSRYFPTNYISGVQLNPQTYFNNGVGLNVAMTAAAGTWTDTLWINGYSGGDVPNMVAIHTSRQATPRMWLSTQSNLATTYGTMYEVISSYNIGSQSVNYAATAGSASANGGNSATTSQVTWTDIYVNSWFRNNATNTGLYNQANTNHFYSRAGNRWGITGNSSTSNIYLDFFGTHQTTQRGSIHADTSNNIGFLNPSEAWSFRVDPSGNAYATGTLSGTNLSGTNTGDQTNISGNAGTSTSTAHLYGVGGTISNWNTHFTETPAHQTSWTESSVGGPSGTWWFIENMRHSNASNYWGKQYAHGWEDNANRLLMRNVSGGTWSGWVEFITSNNIGSQSVNYASTAGSAPANGGTSAACSGTAYLASAVSYLPNRTDGAAYQVLWGAGYTSGSGTIAYSCASVTITSSTGQLSAGILYSSGNVTAYSDERVKTNWRSLTSNFTEKLSNVKSGIYDRTDQVLTQVGVSAQSLRNVIPEAVTEEENGQLSVSYGHAALAACIELAKEIVLLKKELERVKLQ